MYSDAFRRLPVYFWTFLASRFVTDALGHFYGRLPEFSAHACLYTRFNSYASWNGWDFA
jgi:hypothetical protein